MKIRLKRTCTLVLATGLFLVSSLTSGLAKGQLIEDFDGGGSTPFTFDNSGGSAPGVMSGGPTGDFARLANLDGSNNNSIAFDEEPTATGPASRGLLIAFDFRMSDDAANGAAGGCCGSAADGLGIGLYSTATYGASGANNPANGGAIWERPTHPDAFAIGLDVFQNIDVVNLNWGGAEVSVADVAAFLDLNDNTFHRADVRITRDGSDAVVNMRIIQDVNSAAISHDIFVDELITGFDLDSLFNYRLIAGGRTGGAFLEGDIDNILIAPVPESGVPGDANGDNVTDILDFEIIRDNFLTGVTLEQGDVTFDGRVNFEDFRLWKAEVFPAAAAVPEPGAMMLLVGGLLTLAVFRRRLY